MVAVALLVVGITGASRSGKADARPAPAFAVSPPAGRPFVDSAARLTGLGVGVRGPAGAEVSTVPLRGVSLPASGKSSDVTVAGESRRATTAQLPGAGGLELAV